MVDRGILSLLNHLYFVNTFLTSSSYSSEVNYNIFFTLAFKTPIKRLGWFLSFMVFMMSFYSFICIERKGVRQGISSPDTGFLAPAAQWASRRRATSCNIKW